MGIFCGAPGDIWVGLSLSIKKEGWDITTEVFMYILGTTG